MASGAKRDWKTTAAKIMFWGIIAVFGSFLDLFRDIQQSLNTPLSLFQVVQVAIFMIGFTGLAITIFQTVQKPNEEHVPASRYDDFEGHIDKGMYELGQEVFFSTSFTGKLRAGYYESVIVRPDDKIEYSWDPQTLHFPRTLQRGELHGECKHDKGRWRWTVHFDRPIGEYTAHIGVYDYYPLDRATEARVRVRQNWLLRRIFRKKVLLAAPVRPAIAQTTVRFTVVKRVSPDVST